MFGSKEICLRKLCMFMTSQKRQRGRRKKPFDGTISGRNVKMDYYNLRQWSLSHLDQEEINTRKVLK